MGCLGFSLSTGKERAATRWSCRRRKRLFRSSSVRPVAMLPVGMFLPNVSLISWLDIGPCRVRYWWIRWVMVRGIGRSGVCPVVSGHSLRRHEMGPSQSSRSDWMMVSCIWRWLMRFDRRVRRKVVLTSWVRFTR